MNIKPSIKELFDNINDIPITKDRYYILKSEQVEDLKELVVTLDKITEEEMKSMNDNKKWELSTYLNNAERLIRHGVVQ